MSKKLGDRGEEIAEKFLINLGYNIITKNFRTGFAEIDIIAKDANAFVFVEVKSRSSVKFGLPQEYVNKKKLEKIKLASQLFLKMNNIQDTEQRIEVVSILTNSGSLPKIELIKV